MLALFAAVPGGCHTAEQCSNPNYKPIQYDSLQGYAIALGVLSLVSGAGEYAGASFMIGDLLIDSAMLGNISLATGLVGTAVDFSSCTGGHDAAACVGLSLSTPGVLAGGAAILGVESHAAALFAFLAGAAGFGWDLGSASAKAGGVAVAVPPTPIGKC